MIEYFCCNDDDLTNVIHGIATTVQTVRRVEGAKKAIKKFFFFLEIELRFSETEKIFPRDLIVIINFYDLNNFFCISVLIITDWQIHSTGISFNETVYFVLRFYSVCEFFEIIAKFC